MSRVKDPIVIVGEPVKAVSLHTDELGNIEVHPIDKYVESSVYRIIGQVGKGLDGDNVALIYSVITGVVYSYNMDTLQITPFISPAGNYYTYNEQYTRLEPINDPIFKN